MNASRRPISAVFPDRHPQPDRPDRRRALAAAIAVPLVLAGCQSAYFAAMEKIGYEKRDILSSRVEDARNAQEDAKTEVVDALTAFSETVRFEGGELESRYKALAAHLADSEAAARDVRDRVDAVDSVGEALFSEWAAELEQYRSATLKASSRDQMLRTRQAYDRMLAAMRRAESRLDPALSTLRDQVLYLKHNLNARALGALRGEVGRVDSEVRRLVADIEKAVAEANGFIRTLEAPPAARRDS